MALPFWLMRCQPFVTVVHGKRDVSEVDTHRIIDLHRHGTYIPSYGFNASSVREPIDRISGISVPASMIQKHIDERSDSFTGADKDDAATGAGKDEMARLGVPEGWKAVWSSELAGWRYVSERKRPIIRDRRGHVVADNSPDGSWDIRSGTPVAVSVGNLDVSWSGAKKLAKIKDDEAGGKNPDGTYRVHYLGGEYRCHFLKRTCRGGPRHPGFPEGKVMPWNIEVIGQEEVLGGRSYAI